ncbi:MAG: nucleotidyltransferase family protein, partial [Variovorax sp.]
MPADELISAALRGDDPAWPSGGSALDAFLTRATLHGVEPLLYAQRRHADWPAAVLSRLRERAVQRAMWELRHQQVLTQTLSALNDHGIQPVLIKGTSLAYSLYADPALRTRGDTDLIIPIVAKQRVQEVLLRQGYQRHPSVSGEFISYQASYTLATIDGHFHTLDVHWKIN